MAVFEAQLRQELSELATISRGQYSRFAIEGVDVAPRNPKSLGFHWLDSGVFQFGAGAEGNRWELDDAADDAEFAMEIARSIIGGRVRQTTARARSYMVVTLQDGTELHDTAYAVGSWPPILGWKRRSPTTQYEPYSG